MLICKIENCNKPVLVKSRGWCAMHDRRWKRYGDPLGLSPHRHGMGGTAIHGIWYYIIVAYPICDRWKLFNNFYKDVGEKPSYNHHLKQIDSNQPFGPDNFRWSLKKKKIKSSSNVQHLSKVYTFLSDIPPETLNAIYASREEGMVIKALCILYNVCTRVMLEILRNK